VVESGGLENRWAEIPCFLQAEQNIAKSACRSMTCAEFDFTGFPSFSSGFTGLWCQNGDSRLKSTLMGKTVTISR